MMTPKGTGDDVTPDGWTSTEIAGGTGQGGAVLVCEHAGAEIPTDLQGLGLEAAARTSHAAWDIGARDMAVELARLMNAPLVAGRLSRLVYDLNRPLEAADCIPARSEVHEVPGNRDLSQTQRRARFDRVHTPFHDALTEVIDRAAPSALITLHSFTPIYNGARRAVEIGYLYHSDAALACAALAVEAARGRYRCALNEPYAASDGVTYTLRRHGEARGLPAVMVEVRNDLIDTLQSARAMATHLHGVLTEALAELDAADRAESAR
ncbi:N-formylglutamate amidohydrolase [Pseudooceanicola aestuarii]|uniref:N-formylglutamate amidohydrolase n=1 Tax=Pseudooceanicola aestuarii TaxID=2697319 RepID=UPI001EF99EA3|nr:N-formylglutamate amidohydrolase [Pseudooceanicola aestuarii]